MKKMRLVLVGMATLSVTVALAAAPGTKRPVSTKVAPPPAIAPSGNDAMKSEAESLLIPEPTDDHSEVGISETVPETPSPDQFQLESVSPSAVSSAPINMDWYSINSGGAVEVAAGNIKMGLSVGQNAVGEVSAGNIKMGLGFWYGANSATPSCACDCHADPQCDGVTNIFDVTFAVNVAFRGAANISDPNPLCPVQTTDVDCDGVTNIFDVTHIVNVAFRGGNPATEFCNACAPNL